jgi:hypothetical protein
MISPKWQQKDLLAAMPFPMLLLFILLEINL